MSVSLYVEGGGDRQDTLTRCRQGFSEFFRKLLPGKAQPRVIACGSRSQTYRDFCLAVANLKRGDRVLLLVDSEEPVATAHDAWTHLRLQVQDQWQRPPGASEDDVCLMVQCMESWFVADPDTLADYYQRNFQRRKLPGISSQGVEAISKGRIEEALKSATEATTKGRYHKTRHGFDLLARIQPGPVLEASGHARRLREILARWLDDRPGTR